MELIRDYIVDETGKVKKVVLDYETFKKLEGLMLDLGLAKAMEEVKDDEELSLEEAKVLLGSN